MRRRLALLLALLLLALAVATYSSAVPLLVELKIKDLVGSLDESSSPYDVLSPLGRGNDKARSGRGNGRGNGGELVDLRSLTLWLSSDGKNWRKVDGDLVSYASDRVTARINSTGKKQEGSFDLLTSFHTSRDITGRGAPILYVGVSTSAESYTGGRSMAGRLVSWQYARTAAPIGGVSVPQPAMWPLFAAGALGVGLLLRRPKK